MSFRRSPSFHARTNAAGARLQGQYRTVRSEGAMVYVIDGAVASYIPEATYRLRHYAPDFEDLPTEDEYDR